MKVLATGTMVCIALVAVAPAGAMVDERELILRSIQDDGATYPKARGAPSSPVRTGLAPSKPDRRTVQTLTVERMEREIAHYLESRLDGRVSDVEVSLVDPQDSVVVPGGILDVRVTGSGSDEVVGRRHFRLSVAVDGKESDPLPVTADVSLLAEVVAPTRAIKTDELIEADDVAIKRVKLTSLRHDFVSDINDAIGKSASRALPAQSPIRTSALTKPYIVRKGDRVTIEAKRGGLSIQTVGVTKAGGQLGQFVTVTNQDSGKELRGKVVAPGLIQVEF